MECTIVRLNAKNMRSFIRGVFTRHILQEKKLSEFGCSMNQDGGKVTNL